MRGRQLVVEDLGRNLPEVTGLDEVVLEQSPPECGRDDLRPAAGPRPRPCHASTITRAMASTGLNCTLGTGSCPVREKWARTRVQRPIADPIEADLRQRSVGHLCGHLS
jgi:hypothetical protein